MYIVSMEVFFFVIVVAAVFKKMCLLAILSWFPAFSIWYTGYVRDGFICLQEASTQIEFSKAVLIVFFYLTKIVGEEEYNYSGSEDETEEPPEEGEPSSIALAPGESTLRRNFLKLQQEKEIRNNKERYLF